MSQIELEAPLNYADSSRILDDDAADDEWEDFDGDYEGKIRQQRFHTLGYRDGFLAGKEKSMQDGFNTGFNESVFSGQNWGHVRGVTSALTFLPDAMKIKLLVESDDDEKRKRLQDLYESVSAVTTTDALKIFHDRLIKTTQLSEQEQGDVLLDHIREFNMLVHDCSDLSLNLSDAV